MENLNELEETDFLDELEDDNSFKNVENDNNTNLLGKQELKDEGKEEKESKIEEKVQTLPNEIGKVKDVGFDLVTIEITSNIPFNQNLVDHHVVFLTNSHEKIVGTIVSLNTRVAQVKLIGEIQGVRFVPGVLSKPTIDNVCFIATDDETKLIVEDDKSNIIQKVLIGTMPLYNNTPAYVPTNTF